MSILDATELRRSCEECPLKLEELSGELERCVNTSKFAPSWYQQPEAIAGFFVLGFFIGYYSNELKK